MLVAIDIETAPKEGHESYDRAALDLHRAKITCIAWAASDGTSGVVDTVDELNHHISVWRGAGARFGGHNAKFDWKLLITNGAQLAIDDMRWDTMLMAVGLSDKIPDAWLAEYELKRIAENKRLGASVHREAGRHSLKTLAPYFLGVEPFWEDANHSKEYAQRDAQYTLALYNTFTSKLEADETIDFYQLRLMAWARMICAAELRGFALDLDRLKQKSEEAERTAHLAANHLHQAWAPHYQAYEDVQRREIEQKYAQMRLGRSAKRAPALEQAALAKIEPLNLDSPTQLKWLLKERLGLPVTTLDGDESTGKEVLTSLSHANPDVGQLLIYRQARKLSTAFFPQYAAMQWNGAIHCSFNLNGARTGRVSANDPNLMQVPKAVMDMFVARPGYKLVVYDLAGIEPALVGLLTSDPALCRLLISGHNFHSTNTRILFGLPDSVSDDAIKKEHGRERDLAKEVVLAVLYNAGAKRMQACAVKRGFDWDIGRCYEAVNTIRSTYSRAYDYASDLIAQVESGAPVYTMFGRKLRIDPADAYMKSFNSQVQSSASDLLLDCAAHTWNDCRGMGIDVTPVCFVHDSVVFEAEEERALEVRDALFARLAAYDTHTAFGRIPLKFDGGIYDRWGK